MSSNKKISKIKSAVSCELTKKELYDLPPEALLDASEVSVLLGISKSTLSRWRTRGDVALPYRKFGKHVRYVKREVLSFTGKDGGKS